MADVRPTVVRGARVLDGADVGGGPADILIEGDTIRVIGPPGMDAPADAAPVDAADRLILPGERAGLRPVAISPSIGAVRRTAHDGRTRRWPSFAAAIPSW